MTASSANSAYPVTNLYLNDSPKKKWMAANASVTMAYLTIKARPGSNGIGIVGIVADSVTARITDPSGVTWGNVTWGNVEWGVDQPDIELTAEYARYEEWEQSDTRNALWVSFDQFNTPVDIIIEFRKDTGNPAVLAAGVLVIGEMVDTPGVRYPISETHKDNGIYRETSGGGDYSKGRDIARVFSGDINVNRVAHYNRFMSRAGRLQGRPKMMGLVVDNMGNEWVVYGRFQVIPSGSHYSHSRSTINFSFIESVA